MPANLPTRCIAPASAVFAAETFPTGGGCVDDQPGVSARPSFCACPCNTRINCSAACDGGSKRE